MKTINLTLIGLVIIASISFKCSKADLVGPQQGLQLALVNDYSLSVPEPSGLTLNGDGTALYTVSDNTNRVYKIDLTGKILETLDYIGQDLEGIVYDVTDNTLWVVEERLREVVHLSLTGEELHRYDIELDGSGNSGLEGISINNSHSFFILNEKDPGIIAELNADFSVKNQYELPEADDLSGITFDNSKNEYWIISDQSRMIYSWSPENGVSESYSIFVDKAEGVAIDPINNIVYIVSDSKQELYIFSLDRSN